ncbi:MAG: mercuric reductase [Armatimonadota bacterium]|nr:MAG: mercuric reductase [Armatimonadota bacterium]
MISNTPSLEAVPFSGVSDSAFDLIVVGGGAAAFSAAIHARDLGVKVLMVNNGLPLGGTCVNVGCVPSKFLTEALREYTQSLKPHGRWCSSASTLHYARLIEAKDALVSALRQRNYAEVLETLGNVTYIEGYARFVDARTIQVSNRRFRAERLIIATGARVRIPPIPGLRETKPLTNVTALQIKEPPRAMAVIGGGPLGLEFAQIFHRAGSRVTVVEVAERILPQHDPEVSEALKQILEEEGIIIKAGCQLVQVEQEGNAVRLYDAGGCVAEVEKVLVATGIQANTEELGLEAAGVQLDSKGFVVTDERQETTVAGIYAAGDVTGKMPLETVAAKQGYHAAHNALTGESLTIDYDLVPHAVFTDPQAASVGWTEEHAMRKLGSCWCRTLPLEAVPKAHVIRDLRGLVKLVVHPGTHRILGAHAVAPNAAEIIHVPLFAMRAGFTIEELIDTVHVFPTLAEAWKICAQTFERHMKTMSCCVV